MTKFSIFFGKVYMYIIYVHYLNIPNLILNIIAKLRNYFKLCGTLGNYATYVMLE